MFSDTVWKCRICGKPANQLLDKVGPCCSLELQAQNKSAASYEKSRTDLLWALQSRVLTDEEMQRVAQWDYYLLVRQMQPYSEADLRRQFGEMLLLQFKLRLAQSAHCKGKCLGIKALL
jgi:hypothetical protein